MQVLTIKAKPKTIFGIVLALTGIIVILITFLGNHNTSSQTMAQVSCSTSDERTQYLSSLGWEFEKEEKQKEITIPSQFNDVYQNYNTIQKEQGFDLEQFKGKSATLYTYNITNYESSKNVVADLIVADGVLIGADLCDPSADSGFLIALSKNEQN